MELFLHCAVILTALITQPPMRAPLNVPVRTAMQVPYLGFVRSSSTVSCIPHTLRSLLTPNVQKYEGTSGSTFVLPARRRGSYDATNLSVTFAAASYRINSAKRNPGTKPMVISHGLQLLKHTSDGGRCQAWRGRREGRDKKLSVLSPVASTRTTLDARTRVITDQIPVCASRIETFIQTTKVNNEQLYRVHVPRPSLDGHFLYSTCTINCDARPEYGCTSVLPYVSPHFRKYFRKQIRTPLRRYDVLYLFIMVLYANEVRTIPEVQSSKVLSYFRTCTTLYESTFVRQYESTSVLYSTTTRKIDNLFIFVKLTVRCSCTTTYESTFVHVHVQYDNLSLNGNIIDYVYTYVYVRVQIFVRQCSCTLVVLSKYCTFVLSYESSTFTWKQYEGTRLHVHVQYVYTYSTAPQATLVVDVQHTTSGTVD